MRNLDAEWTEKHPQHSREELTVTLSGRQLVRREEVPLSAFTTIEQSGPDRQFAATVAAIRECIAPESQAVYDELVTAGALTVPRLLQLWQALIEDGVGRPTERPAGSSPGSSANGTRSTDGRSTGGASTSAPLGVVVSPTSPMPTS